MVKNGTQRLSGALRHKVGSEEILGTPDDFRESTAEVVATLEKKDRNPNKKGKEYLRKFNRLQEMDPIERKYQRLKDNQSKLKFPVLITLAEYRKLWENCHPIQGEPAWARKKRPLPFLKRKDETQPFTAKNCFIEYQGKKISY